MNYGLSLLLILCLGAVAFFLKFLLELWASRRRTLRALHPGKGKRGTPGKWTAAIAACVFGSLLHAQTTSSAQAASAPADTNAMQTR
ncbi:MAG TPA: hypothetical protein VK466_14855, partial [Terriglobales bacterium]|nr:hypothetical protein [Terriglobales bacterium]